MSLIQRSASFVPCQWRPIGTGAIDMHHVVRTSNYIAEQISLRTVHINPTLEAQESVFHSILARPHHTRDIPARRHVFWRRSVDQQQKTIPLSP